MTDRAGPCISAQTPAMRESIGAYVLGALEEVENETVTAHLAVCGSCRAEYLDLVGLPPLLAALTEAEAVRGSAWPGLEVPDRVVSVLRTATAGSPTAMASDPASSGSNGPGRAAATRARRSTSVVAAVGLALVVGIGYMGIRAVAGQSSAPIAWTATATSAADPDAVVTGSVQVAAATWGSTIRMTIEHVPDRYKCTIIVVAVDGHRETAGTWRAPATGTVTIPGTVGIGPDQIASIQVQLPDGTTLLMLPHP